MNRRFTRPLFVLSLALSALLAWGCEREQDNAGQRPPTGAIHERMATPLAGNTAAQATAAQADDVEPNDSTEQATPLRFLSGERPLISAQGVLTGGRADIDVFHIEADPRVAVVAVSLVPVTPERDLSLTVRGADGQAFTLELGGVGQAEMIPNVGLGEGGVHLQVSGSGEHDLAYRLEVAPRDSGQRAEREPNDAPAAAGPLTLGAPLTGWVNRAGDVDHFTLPDGDGEAPLALTITPPRSAPLSVALTDGEREVWSARLEDGRPRVYRHLTARPHDAYRLRVTSTAPVTAAQPYTVRVAAMEGQGPWELEPNDDRARAQRVRVDERVQVLRAGLDGADDVDHYQLQVAAPPPGAPRVLTARAIPQGDVLDLALRSVHVEHTLETAHDDARAGGVEAVCNLALDGPATLDLEVRAAGADGAAHDYRLEAQVRDATGEEREPNGIPASASPLTTSLPIAGYIHPVGDLDVYRFVIPPSAAPAGGTARVNVQLDAGYPANLIVELRDDQNARISERDQGQVGEGELIVADLPPGTYHVAVRAHAMASCSRPYQLSVDLPQSTVNAPGEGGLLPPSPPADPDGF